MPEIFVQLAFVIGITVIISLILKQLKQPLIVGYILSGIIVGPSLFNFVRHGDSIEIFATLGVAFLLFIVGLGLNPKMIKDVGSISIITGLAQIAFTSIIGFLIGILLGLPATTALYIAIAFTFSSTIIILQLLYDKKDQNTLYGRISIGFLLIQDLVAMLIFVFLSSSSGISPSNIFSTLSSVIVKLAIIAIVMYVLWKEVIPRVDSILAENRQVLFLFSIATCFSTASLFYVFGFSLELGALVAGLLLSTSPYHQEIATRIQPLRDFFLVIFFIFLGANISIGGILNDLPLIIIFSIFILIGNPLIVLLIMTALGYTRRTSFFSGLTVAQISEFSLIMLSIGAANGHISQKFVGIGALVGLVTIAASSYMITYNHEIYTYLEPYIRKITPFAKTHDKKVESYSPKFEVLLLGAHRLGGGIIEILEKRGIDYLVIDYDPHLVSHLRNKNVPVIFGSADDAIFLDELDFRNAKMVISTVPDLKINLFVADYIKNRKKSIQIISVANHHEDAKILYEEGVNLVVMPPYLGRRFMQDMLDKNMFSKTRYEKEKKKHLKDLEYLRNSISTQFDKFA